MNIKQDGNCFFSAISFQLLGMQDEDIAVRNVIHKTITLNKITFFAVLNSIIKHQNN